MRTRRRSHFGCIFVLLAASLALAQDRILSTNGSSFTPLSITTTALPSATIGTAYIAALAATGGTPPYDWLILAGTGGLGPDLSLNASTGVISGTPAPPGGTPTFTVQVQDSSSPAKVAFATLRITIAGVGGPLFISTTNLPAGAVSTAYSITLEAFGGTPPYNNWTVSSGALPAGLSLDPASGTISGTPTAIGESPFTIRMADSASAPATATTDFSITINATQASLSVAIGPSGAQNPAQQPTVTVTLSSPTSLTMTGLLTLTFASAVGVDDQLVRFSNGRRTAPFFISAGFTQATFAFESLQPPTVAVLTGTVAGTITITAALSASGTDVTPTPAPTATITIAKATPVITKVTLNTNTGGGTFTVSAAGYSTTRDMTTATFHFHPARGIRLAQTDVSVDVRSAFTTWYSSTASNAYGSAFTLTVPFTFGGPLPITTITMDLTNSFGTSASAGP